ncbi:putative ATP-dependent RNA helicase DDX60 isoform 2-T2 [Discoglossus pictus]
MASGGYEPGYDPRDSINTISSHKNSAVSDFIQSRATNESPTPSDWDTSDISSEEETWFQIPASEHIMTSEECDPREGICLINSDRNATDSQDSATDFSQEISANVKMKSNDQDGTSSEENIWLQIPELEKYAGFIEDMGTFVMKQLSKALFASLLNDYVESEFFLIDGDSLMLNCITDASLQPGQNLHFFFLIERFLLNLSKKGATYSIVFFEDVEHFHFQRPDLIRLRTQLKLHLEKNTDINIHTFSNFLSPAWNTFLSENYPYFLMVSDEGMNISQTNFLNLLILNALGNKIHVVLTSGQEVDHLRVYGFHVNSKMSQKLYVQKNKKKINEVTETLIEFSKKSHKAALQSTFQTLLSETMNEKITESITLLSSYWSQGSDIRQITCVISCAVILRLYDDISKMQDKANNEELEDCNPTQNDDSGCLTLEEAADLCRMYCLSVAFLLILPLSQRAKCRKINATWSEQAVSFLEMQKRCGNITLREVSKLSNWKVTWTHISDLSDDLLMQNIAYYYENEECTELKLELGNEIDQKYSYLWNSILQLVPLCKSTQSCQIRSSSKKFLSSNSSVNGKHEKIPTVGLIPMESDFVEEYVGDIMKELPFLRSDDPVVRSLTQQKPYDELLHWHSGRPLSDEYDRTKNNFGDGATKKDIEFRNKQDQKLRTFQRFYGQSLGLHVSKTITVSQEQADQKSAEDKAFVKKQQTQKTKKDIIIEENQKRNNAKFENKEIERWKSMASSLQQGMKESFFLGIKRQEDFIKSLQTHSVKLSAEFAALKTCFEVWLEHCKIQKVRDINIAVEVMKKIQTILNKYQDMLQKDDLQRIAKYLSSLGFENLASSLKSKVGSIGDMKEESELSVGVGSTRFQMKYMGHYLLRDERTDPDPRVQHFIPDTWQRELLDVVDNNESAVIVAPTSSGKTYASYYCMEKILKQSNTAIVVYVAPTKVLVTVPQCLEILLLAPHRQEWVKRIKYVIFDEIHCLGGEIGAEVWEHLLVMIRCPFLALSATISNPEHLTAWLQSVKHYWQHRDKIIESSNSLECIKKRGKNKNMKTEKKSYRVRLVSYEKRYNDLEKYVCSLRGSEIDFEHYHPCAALTIDHMEKYGIPADLTFSPRESIQLYDIMVAVWPGWSRIKELDPEEYLHFKDKICITKNDAKLFEEELKKELVEWIGKGHRKKICKVLKSFQPPEPSDKVDCFMHFPILVEKLRENDKLPAIVFAFHLDMVENLAKASANYLIEKQEIKQPKLTPKEVDKLQSKSKRLVKSIEKNLRSAKKTDSLLIDVANHESIRQKLKKINEIPPDCTYADYSAVNREILREVFFRTRNAKRASRLRILASRGIGYHHGSVDAKGRQLVEMLFRMGFLRVVTATGTLALGINMPCKSVVFLHDSIYLDALNYRQMSGRAGRRGQDLLGNVFFFNIPMPKVKKLMKSNVPQLKGQFPLGISLVLKLMLLVAKADNKEDAKAKALSILKHSLMSFKQPREIQMLKMYFLFSLHFLICEGYLDRAGIPMAFTGLVSHLHYHEPANFVFVSFLEKGLFDQLCQTEMKDTKHFPLWIMETLVLVLANLFGRHYLVPSMLKLKGTFCQSKVFLDNLPDDFAAALQEYNRKIAKIFGNCLVTVSKLADMEQECKLPLSQINFSGKELQNSQLVNHLMTFTDGRSAISPFACLSGNTDHDLFNLTNINSLLLQTAYINVKNIPILHLEKKDACGRRMILNSYVLDFFKHGSLPAIVEDNGFNEGMAYYLLKDFLLSVSSISVSLKEMCGDENNRVVLAFEQLQEMFKKKLNVL